MARDGMTVAPLSLQKRVTLLPYQPREPIAYIELTNEEILFHTGKVLICDTETYKNYHVIIFKLYQTNKYIILSFPYNREKLHWILHHYTIVGFNLHKYDLPVMWCGHDWQLLSKIQEVSNAIIYNNVYPKQLEIDFNFKIQKTNTIDLIEICPGNSPKSTSDVGFTRPKSLKLYMGRLHSKRLQELPFPVHEDLSSEQIEIVNNYCINDLIGTEEVFTFNKDRIQLREELGRDYGTDLRSKSDAQMAEAMVAHEIKKLKGWWPRKADLDERRIFYYTEPVYLQYDYARSCAPFQKYQYVSPVLQQLLADVTTTEFICQYGRLSKPSIFDNYQFQLEKLRYKFGIGGLHSCEENVSYRANETCLLIDRDVASYYPAIIINQGLCPKHLGPVFSTIYRRMRDDRIEAKRLKLFAKDKGLKIALNGVSGKFNSEYSIFYDPQCYLQMTLTGQLSILMLAEMFESIGAQVISANTDGVVSYCPHSQYNAMLDCIVRWERLTGFVTEETRYKAYYGRDVNAYFALKEDGTVKVKGPYSEVGSQTGTKLDNNPITLICSDAVKALIAHNTPIEKTIRECRDITRFVTVRNVASPGAHQNGNYLGKVVRWVYERNNVNTINYVASGNRVPESDGALPLQDLPEQWPDIDYQKYIDKTIEILYEIDWLKKPKQMRLI